MVTPGVPIDPAGPEVIAPTEGIFESEEIVQVTNGVTVSSTLEPIVIIPTPMQAQTTLSHAPTETETIDPAPPSLFPPPTLIIGTGPSTPAQSGAAAQRTPDVINSGSSSADTVAILSSPRTSTGNTLTTTGRWESGSSGAQRDAPSSPLPPTSAAGTIPGSPLSSSAAGTTAPPSSTTGTSNTGATISNAPNVINAPDSLGIWVGVSVVGGLLLTLLGILAHRLYSHRRARRSRANTDEWPEKHRKPELGGTALVLRRYELGDGPVLAELPPPRIDELDGEALAWPPPRGAGVACRGCGTAFSASLATPDLPELEGSSPVRVHALICTVCAAHARVVVELSALTEQRDQLRRTAGKEVARSMSLGIVGRDPKVESCRRSRSIGLLTEGSYRERLSPDE